MREVQKVMEKEWSELTPEEKRKRRFKRWLEEPGVEFSSIEAGKVYRERVKRLQDVLLLKEPDRVPVSLPIGNFPIYYAGSTLQKVMYDYDELCRVWRKFLYDFSDCMDTFSGPGIYSAKVFEHIGFKMYKWPGYGLAPDVSSFQFVEEEYMRADEYDDLIQDPSDFALRVFMPRTISALEPFKNLVPFSSVMGIGSAIGFVSPGARPDVRDAFKAIFDAGIEQARWQKTVGACSREVVAAGFPSIRGASALAPFDSIADILRGTTGVSKDMYRQPDKLLEAMEKISVLTIKQAINSANAFGAVAVGMPLHKGDDTFMSDKQFETFYWPTLKKLILAFIKEGLIVMLAAEGQYNRRLEVIQDLPRGWTHWMFDQTDMARAKKIVGKNACISGNVPSSLMMTGTPRDVKEYCRTLIKVCGEGGGYILSGGSAATETNPENLRVFMEAAKEYGTYR
jgi:hypothetical protein